MIGLTYLREMAGAPEATNNKFCELPLVENIKKMSRQHVLSPNLFYNVYKIAA